MLKDLDSVFAALQRWATEYPILGFLAMGICGGIVAVLMAYQKAGIVFTWSSFFARCAAKGFIGVVLAAGVFFAWRGMGFGLDWGYIIAGICGIGGSDIAEALVLIFISKLKQRASVMELPPERAMPRGTPGDER